MSQNNIYERNISQILINNYHEDNEIEKSDKFKLVINNEKYFLLLSYTVDNKLLFKLGKQNQSDIIDYYNEYEYKEITNLLYLHKKYYHNIYNVFTYYIKSLRLKNVRASEDKNRGVIKLKLKKSWEFNNIECVLELKKESKEMVKLMEESINNLEKTNKEYAKKIKELKERIKFDLIEKNKEKN